MTNPIVTVNVSQQIAPAPSLLQKTGALISQGGTSLGVGAYSLLRQESDLEDLLPDALAVTSVAWSSAYGGQITVTTAVAHGIPTNQEFITTLAGFVPTAYNGSYKAISTGASTFTAYLTSDPGAQTTAGTYTQRNVGELVAMANTFFAQGYQQSIYVLELGAGSASAGVSALEDFIEANAQFFYSYLVPRNWDGVAEFITFLANYNNTTSKTYFWITSDIQDYIQYDDTMKCAVVMVENPTYGTWSQISVSNATWTGSVATVTTGSAHGIAPGDFFTLTGIVPTGYNGTFEALPGTTASTLKYSKTPDPGAYSSGGTLQRSLYESAGVPATEFSHASDHYRALNYAPSSVNKVAPFAFGALIGVTEFETPGNASLLATLKAANINYVGNGGEGGISNKILYWGRTMDGRPFNYWYSIDWMQINAQRALANAIINGSNTPINPLYYDQVGIDRLQQAVIGTAESAIAYGLALGSVIATNLTQADFNNNLNRGIYNGNVVINAIPFTSYLSENPSDYRTGTYAGLSIVYTPLRGFEAITINIVATDFVAA